MSDNKPVNLFSLQDELEDDDAIIQVPFRVTGHTTEEIDVTTSGSKLTGKLCSGPSKFIP